MFVLYIKSKKEFFLDGKKNELFFPEILNFLNLLVFYSLLLLLC
ncbi:hypothetical protein EV201_0217 [Ancylomarina subtilis]|uniref:Uncharacterized protein n=1 Tax=Ancylomarina subtilis TaxID=1639035 RepID=A0A4Q7VHS6_9BACT|nr:hypothetical protein EV201_0217 [Ancylomarina subtilis]